MKVHVMETIDYHVRQYLQTMVNGQFGAHLSLIWHMSGISAAYDYTDDIEVANFSWLVIDALRELRLELAGGIR